MGQTEDVSSVLNEIKSTGLNKIDRNIPSISICLFNCIAFETFYISVFKMESETKTEGKKSASYSLEGYVYQRDVTVWLGLSLIVEKQVCAAIVVEPANEEDAEAAIDSSDYAETNSDLETDQYTLTLQVKSRSTGPWDIGAMKSLLEHGKRRDSALKQLEDKDRRFILITDADLRDTARSLSINSPLSFSKNIPASLKCENDASLIGRLGVLARLDREKLDHRINSLLSDRFKVPSAKREKCYKILGDQVFALMRQGGGRLTRATLIDIIRKHGGYLGGFAEEDIFVPPSNIDKFHEALRDHHAVIIRGPSGTGKTFLSEYLINGLLETYPTGCIRVKPKTPTDIRAQDVGDSVVFDIEDPWGKYKPSDNAAEWTADLRDQIRSASADRRFVITTRSDLFTAADVKNLDQFIVDLTAEHYTTRDRTKIYNARLEKLPIPLKRLANRQRAECLRELETPLEIQKFFDLLREPRKGDEADRAFVHRALDSAKNEAIEDRIVKTVREEKHEKEAALIWGFLAAFPKLPRLILEDVLLNLEGISDDILDQADEFAARLIERHTLRLRDGHLSYRHNRDEKGLRESFDKQRRQASRLSSALVEYLLAASSRDLQSGAINLAAQIQDDKLLSLQINRETQSILDAELLSRSMSCTPDTGERNFHRLAALGSPDARPTQLAKWLTHRSGDDGFFGMLTRWTPSQDTDAFYAEMSADPHAVDLIRAYLINVAPILGHQKLGGLWKRLYRVDPDIGSIFRSILMEHLDAIEAIDTNFFMHGAFKELDKCGEVATAIVEQYSHYDNIEIFNETQSWDHINEVMPDEEAQNHFEYFGMDHYSTRQLLKCYVEEVRTRLDWRTLVPILTTPSAIGVWLDVIKKDEEPADPAEIEHLYQACQETEDEPIFWKEIEIRNAGAFHDRALTLSLINEPNALRDNALKLMVQFDAFDGKGFIEALRLYRGATGVTETLFSLRSVMTEDALFQKVTQNIMDALTVEEKRVLDLVSDEFPLQTPSPDDKNLLLNHQDERARSYQLRIMRALALEGDDIGPFLREQLQKAYKPSSADRSYLGSVVEVIEELDLTPILSGVFTHEHSIVRAGAFRAALSDVETFPDHLLPFLGDKSRDVLDIVSEFIKDLPLEACQAAIEVLIKNESYAIEQGAQYSTVYPYAYAASERLQKTAADISPETVSFALERARESDDRDMAQSLIRLAARFGHQPLINLIYDISQDSNESESLREDAILSIILEKKNPDIKKISTKTLINSFAKAPISIAKWVAILTGQSGSLEQIRKVVPEISRFNNRPLLALPLAFGLHCSDRFDLRDNALKTLKPVLAEKLIKAIAEEKKISADDIDGIGHIAVREVIIEQFRGIIFEDL